MGEIRKGETYGAQSSRIFGCNENDRFGAAGNTHFAGDDHGTRIRALHCGKIFKFKINEFAIGFGPALYKRTKKNGEVFSVRALPLGGYCAFEGEDEENSHPDAFNNKKPWQRIIVLFAGAFMNYLLALLLIITSFFAYGQLLLMTYRVDTSEYTQSGIAVAGYSFQDEDVIIRCEEKGIYLTSDLMEVLEGKKEGDLVTFLVSRKGETGRSEQEIKVMLRSDADFKNLTDTGALWDSLGIARQYEQDGETYIHMVASASYKGFGFLRRSADRLPILSRSAARSSRYWDSCLRAIWDFRPSAGR